VPSWPFWRYRGLEGTDDVSFGIRQTSCKHHKLTGLDSIEQVLTPSRVLDVCINQERVGLGVNVLHHDLETVEELCFGALNFGRESLDEVLVDDTVRLARCKALAGYLKY
jgi:hypothetical protein